jgi:hypothetical protein
LLTAKIIDWRRIPENKLGEFVVYYLGFFFVLLVLATFLIGFEQQAEYSFPSITVLAVASTHGFSGSVGEQYGHL